MVCASVCWRANSVIDTRSVRLLLSQSRNVRVGGSSRFPATLSYDFLGQPTISCDLVRSVGALSKVLSRDEWLWKDGSWAPSGGSQNVGFGMKAGPVGLSRGMSVVGGRAEDICSYRTFLSLTTHRRRRSGVCLGGHYRTHSLRGTACRPGQSIVPV